MGPFLSVVGGIATLIGSITILVAAFKRSVLTGFLTLLVPLYILYFVFAQYESENKGKIFLLWFGGIGLGIIGAIITAVTQGSVTVTP